MQFWLHCSPGHLQNLVLLTRILIRINPHQRNLLNGHTGMWMTWKSHNTFRIKSCWPPFLVLLQAICFCHECFCSCSFCDEYCITADCFCFCCKYLMFAGSNLNVSNFILLWRILLCPDNSGDHHITVHKQPSWSISSHLDWTSLVNILAT